MHIKDPAVAADVKAIMKKDVYKIMKEASRVSRDAIDTFYGDYQPEYYQRVYGLKDLFNIDLEENDGGYTLRYTYSFANISGHTNPSVIFYGPFIQGYHGGPMRTGNGSVSAPQMSPSPWEIIEDFANNIGGVIS